MHSHHHQPSPPLLIAPQTWAFGHPEFIGKDERLLDNTHLAKQKFGVSKGDNWADKASEDLLKVKGKGVSVWISLNRCNMWH